MNHLKNDKNQNVIAIGAPGSISRLKCEYPQLIENLQKHYNFMVGSHSADLIDGVMKQRILDLYPDTFTKYEIQALIELGRGI